MSHTHKGFTLIEMAIVIAIIALVTGGIIFARDMIRNSELRAVADESQQYIQALNNFYTKYSYYPGDMPTATSIWPAADAVAATCKTTVTELNKTCNGDGNSWITTQGNSTTFYEQFRAWQHLKLAGLIEQVTTPITDATLTGNQQKTVGYNIPTSKMSGAGWGLVGLRLSDVTAYSLISYYENDVPPRHVFILGGGAFPSSDNSSQMPIMSPSEALALDRKLDDGYPNHGKIVRQINPAGRACTNSVTAYSTTDDRICALVFKSGL